MLKPSVVLQRIARDFADVIPKADADAQHSRWKSGIGPFEEENQIEMILDELPAERAGEIKTEAPYPGNQQRCDMVVETGGITLPDDSVAFRFSAATTPSTRVFSPFHEHSSRRCARCSSRFRR